MALFLKETITIGYLENNKEAKMTEHVCEWRATVGVRSHKWEDGCECFLAKCRNIDCNKTLSWADVEARLNATERLSAEDARVIGQVHEGKTEDILRAYADMLEEKS